MPGFDTGSVLYALNVDFTGNSLTSGTPQVVADGQLLIGSSVQPNIRVATLMAGTGVSITNGHGTITIGLSGGGGAVEHLTGDSGGQLNPDGSNNFTLTALAIGLSFVGAASTLTLGGILKLANGGTNAALTASNGGVFYSTATAGAILSGTSTANQVLLSGASSAPAWSTATYPPTTTINQILYSSSNNVVAGLATANNGVLTTGTSGIPVITALAVDGQLIIGSSAGAPVAATLSAGTGITITNGHNSISIAASTAVLTFTTVNHAASPYTVLAADQFLEVDSSAGTVSILLPNAPTTGRIIYIKDTAGKAATNNISVTTVGGSVTIDGQTTYTMAANYTGLILTFDGTSYYII